MRYWIVVGDRGTLDGGGPAQLTISSPLGACCLPNEACAMLSGPECAAAGGLFQGNDSACLEPGYEAGPGDCGVFEDIAATGTALALDEDDGQVIPIGFGFPFFGQTFTEIGVSANGYLAFDGDLGDFTNDPIPNAAPPNGLIAPLWTDLSPQAGGAVHYELRGASGLDLRLIVQWGDVPRFGQQDANTFQAVLFENGDIEFRYGQISPAPFPRACTIGVESPDGERGTAIDAAAVGSGQSCIFLEATTLGVECATACPCELDGAAPVNVFDLIAYLDGWFIAAPRGEFDGIPGITVLDLLAYLQCWFPASSGMPCP